MRGKIRFGRIFGRALLTMILLMGAFLSIQYAWNGEAPSNKPDLALLAHRAVHHDYQRGVYDVKTGCEARHIFPPTHTYFGNTIPSITAAFAYGADIVEIDIRKTADNHLMVYHDFQLACRTNGEGLVRDQNVAYLKTLDVGYGYTADSGATYPLRGKGRGLMSTLEEVLETFPGKCFLLDHKDWDQASLDLLVDVLECIPPTQRSRLYFWSNPDFQRQMQRHFPKVNPLFLTRKQAREEFGAFFLSFGMIGISDEYVGRAMALPAAHLPYVWGWPYRFLNRVHAEGLKFYLMVDDPVLARSLAHLPVDGFITDHIETVGPALLPVP
ncbi:MAG: glycerophosphodiester phosphodiesterase family protein [Bacteroidota bacterium]